MSQFGCPICQEKLNSALGVNISALPCGHVFHEDCIKRWLRCRPSCPHCRNRSSPTSLLKLYFNYSTSETSVCDSSTSAADLFEQNQNLRMEVLLQKEKVNALEAHYLEQAKSNSEFQNLYNQTANLLQETNQKYSRAKAQLASYHEVLAEAEAMKVECFTLREHVERLKDVEVLLRGSESAAEELMGKYRDQEGNYSSAVIKELFKWLAVLRSELSDQKLRIQKYRKDAYRLRRAHVSSNNRVSSLERKLETYKSRIGQLEADLAHICEQSEHSTSELAANGDPVNSILVTPSVSNAASPSNETRLDLSGCLSFIDSTTPEINYRSGGLAAPAFNVANITPLVNPFKKISKQIDKAKSNKSNSSLFKLAIMRNYEQASNGTTDFKCASHEGFGGPETISASSGEEAVVLYWICGTAQHSILMPFTRVHLSQPNFWPICSDSRVNSNLATGIISMVGVTSSMVS
ncbi:hypothetical protein Aperf_G00000033061 [Anoplocephala perfoliata]